MANWQFRSCPRCGGDIFMDTEEGDWFSHCLQCGFTGVDKSPLREEKVCQPVGRPLHTAHNDREPRHTRLK